MESAVGIHFRRGKQRVSRLLSWWNSSVYSSVLASRNPDFDLGCRLCRHPKIQDFLLYPFFACGDRIWTCLAHLEIWSSALPLCVLSAELPISRLHHLPSSATGSGRCCSPGNPSVAGHKKRYKIFFLYPFFACGDRIWTCDLRVMRQIFLPQNSFFLFISHLKIAINVDFPPFSKNTV